jgi:hypothetical protein
MGVGNIDKARFRSRRCTLPESPVEKELTYNLVEILLTRSAGRWRLLGTGSRLDSSTWWSICDAASSRWHSRRVRHVCPLVLQLSLPKAAHNSPSYFLFEPIPLPQILSHFVSLWMWWVGGDCSRRLTQDVGWDGMGRRVVGAAEMW